MSFKKWLNIQETGNVRVRPKGGPVQQAPGIVATSDAFGAAAQFGRRGTPIPADKAIAGVASGIGHGVSLAMADTGYEPSPIPQIEKFPTFQDKKTEYGSLFLQLPYIPSDPNKWQPGFRPNSITSYDSDISKQVHKLVQYPDDDPRVRKPNDNSKNDSKFATLQMMGTGQSNLFGVAKNFTRALIKISVIQRLKEQGLDKKYDLPKGKLGKEYEENGNLVCVFYFEKYKTAEEEEVKE